MRTLDRGVRQAREGNRGMLAFGQAESTDESLKALNFILEAWEEGTGSGIAPELMAYAALYTALTDLVAAFGEDSVVSLVNGLGAADREGRIHALPVAAIARRHASAYQKRRRLKTISPISTPPNAISTSPAMRLILPSRTWSSRCRTWLMRSDTTNQ